MLTKLSNSVYYLAEDFNFDSTYDKLRSQRQIKSLEKSEKGLIVGNLDKPHASFQISSKGRVIIYYGKYGDITKIVRILKSFIACSKLKKERDLPRTFEAVSDGIVTQLGRKSHRTDLQIEHSNELKKCLVDPLLGRLQYFIIDEGQINLKFISTLTVDDLKAHPLFDDLVYHDKRFGKLFKEFVGILLDLKESIDAVRPVIKRTIQDCFKLLVVEAERWDRDPRQGALSSYLVGVLLALMLDKDPVTAAGGFVKRINTGRVETKIEYRVGGYTFAIADSQKVPDDPSLWMEQRIIETVKKLGQKGEMFKDLIGKVDALESSKEKLVEHLRLLKHYQCFRGSCRFVRPH